MQKLPCRIEAFHEDARPALTALRRITDEADGRQPRSDKRLLSAFRPERDALLARTHDGRAIGWTETIMSPHNGTAGIDGAVHPDFRRCGIGRRLLRAAESAAARRAGELPPGVPLTTECFAPSTLDSALALFGAEGYGLSRTIFEMLIDLADRGDPPPLPAGLELRPVDPEHHGAPIHEAYVRAFTEPGSVPKPYAFWADWQMNPAYFQPALWLALWERDRVVGFCLNRPSPRRPGAALLSLVGVVPEHRRRGLAALLLQRTWATLRAQGFSTAWLLVQKDNAHGAVQQYERAGMRASCEIVTYQKRVALGGTYRDLRRAHLPPLP